jgi:MYXO-CTERM domain-containing protein
LLLTRFSFFSFTKLLRTKMAPFQHLRKLFVVVITTSILAWFFFLSIRVSAASLTSAARNPSVRSPEEAVLQAPASPLTATLTMPVVPGINQPALLLITVGSVREAPNMTVELELPPGASVVEGPDQWEVALHPGQTQTLTTTIQFGQTGQQEILVHLRQPIDANNAFLGEGALGVTIGEEGGVVGFEPAEIGQQQEVEVVSPLAPPSSEEPSARAQPRGLNCLNPALVGLLTLGMFGLHRRR